MLLGTRRMTLKRYDLYGSRGSDGRLAMPAVSTSEIEVSLQPLKSHELQRLPEGERQRDQRKAYTYTQLRTSDQLGAYQADELVDDVEDDATGHTYQVAEIDPYNDGMLGHHKARVVRLQET